QRQHRLAGAIARLLGAAAGAVALDDEDLGALGSRLRAVGELAREAKLARCGLPVDLLLFLAPEPLLGALDRPVEELVGLLRRGGEPMVEGIAERGVDDAGGFRRAQPVLG